MPQRLMLLDTASLYFRAFHGIPETIRREDGTPVNAVRGLLDMVARLVAEFRPTHMVACWDNDWRPGWRVELVPTYKQHRLSAAGPAGTEEVPPGLNAQVPLIRELLTEAGIAVVGCDGYEADDVIGTYAETSQMPTDVVTGDRDLFQLIDDERQIRVLNTARGMKNLEVMDEQSVVAKYRVLPIQYADYATLRGDPSDGLPGVSGIGEKTAASLLGEYGTLQGLLDAAADAGGEVSAPVRARLSAARDYLSVAPRVVRVAQDLSVPPLAGARLHAPAGETRARLETRAEQWNVEGPMKRFLQALEGAAG